MTATILDDSIKTNQTTSGGGLVATSTGAGGVEATRCVSGKSYFEAVITTLTGTPSLGLATGAYLTTAVLGALTSSIAYRPSGIVVINNVTVATIAAYVQGNRIGVAIDPILQQIWFRVNNGNWNNNVANDPATGVGGIDYSTGNTGRLAPAFYASLTGTVWTTKFTTPFTDVAPTGFVSFDNVGYTLARNVSVSEQVIPLVAQSVIAARSIPSPTCKYNRAFSPAGAITVTSGVVKELGVAVAGKTIRSYDRVTGEYLGCATSAGDGTYSIPALGRAKVQLVAFDLPYNALVLDNVTPG